MSAEAQPNNGSASAEKLTRAALNDIEFMIKDNPQLAVIYCNSMIAAVQIVYEKYGVDRDVYRPLFEEVWKPIVARMSAE